MVLESDLFYFFFIFQEVGSYAGSGNRCREKVDSHPSLFPRCVSNTYMYCVFCIVPSVFSFHGGTIRKSCWYILHQAIRLRFYLILCKVCIITCVYMCILWMTFDATFWKPTEKLPCAYIEIMYKYYRKKRRMFTFSSLWRHTQRHHCVSLWVTQCNVL